jgi:hypothetical protein
VFRFYGLHFIPYFDYSLINYYMGMFETSLNDGQHLQLSQFCGRWAGTMSTWFEEDVLADRSDIKGNIRPVLGGRFAMHEYESSFQGKPLIGLSIYGFDLQKQKWQSVLIDSFHMSTGIMFSEGESTRDFSVTGSYDSYDAEPQKWGWRTEILLPDPKQLVIRYYNITPDGIESKAVEILYQRLEGVGENT